jgi:hypothetical protein
LRQVLGHAWRAEEGQRRPPPHHTATPAGLQGVEVEGRSVRSTAAYDGAASIVCMRPSLPLAPRPLCPHRHCRASAPRGAPPLRCSS